MNEPSVSKKALKQNVTVGVGEVVVSNDKDAAISTYALGSCIAVVAYDSHVKAGGVIHLMLPDSRLSPEKANQKPAMFADTGIPMFLRNLFQLGAENSRVKTFVAGGASVITGSDMFKIGERNIAATKKIANDLSINVIKADIGGVSNRTLCLNISTGDIVLKTTRGTATFSIA